jgi:ribosomal subunit interface protein
VGSKTRSAGRVPLVFALKGVSAVDIIFKGRHTDVLERFRKHATAKLTKIEKLARKAIRIDVEVSKERNPRLSGRRERVELTILSRGPAIRAEAAAEDRYAALDIAVAKLESRLRRAHDRKTRHGTRGAGKPAARLAGAGLEDAGLAGGSADAGELADGRPAGGDAAASGAADEGGAPAEGVVPIEMQGDGPLVVREKFHHAKPMSIDQALFEMELVGHDFFLFRDSACGHPSVVYRRRGYDYGVIRLVEDTPAARADPGAGAAPGRSVAGEVPAHGAASANGQAQQPAGLGRY